MNTARFRRAFGLVVRERRHNLEVSQEELAALIGIHRTYLGSVERGERNVGLDNLLRFSFALRTQLSDLVREAEAKDRQAARR